MIDNLSLKYQILFIKTKEHNKLKKNSEYKTKQFLVVLYWYQYIYIKV